MMPIDFYYFLKRRLREPLPGRKAQLIMAPQPVDFQASPREMAPPPGAHPSSVLILIFPDEHQQLNLILTLRIRGINHGGEISFPGGRAEPRETQVGTALREAEEEIGLTRGNIKIAGKLSDLYVAHSNNYVAPVIGFLNSSPLLAINPDEVEEVFPVSLAALLNEDNLTVETWQLHSKKMRVPYWNIHSTPLWGVTAMILSEFLVLYREFNEQISNED